MLMKMRIGNPYLGFMILSFLTSFCALSSELSHLNLNGSVAETSDELSLRTKGLSLTNNRRNFVYPFDGAQSDALDFGVSHFDSHGTAAEIHFDHSLTEVWLGKKYKDQFFYRVFLGHDEIEGEKDSSFTKYKVEFEYKKEDLYSKLSYGHRSTIFDYRYPKAINSYLKTHPSDFLILWTPGKYRAKALFLEETLSDGNSASYQDLELKYNVSFGEYWVLVGGGLEVYKNSKQFQGYWTPETFISFGPRFEASGPFVRSTFFSFALNLNRFEDENNDHGQGHYLNVALQSAQRNTNHFKVGYEKIQSTQRSSLWSFSRPYISYNHFW